MGLFRIPKISSGEFQKILRNIRMALWPPDKRGGRRRRRTCCLQWVLAYNSNSQSKNIFWGYVEMVFLHTLWPVLSFQEFFMFDLGDIFPKSLPPPKKKTLTTKYRGARTERLVARESSAMVATPAKAAAAVYPAETVTKTMAVSEPRFWKASQKAQNGVNKSHQSKQAKKSRHFLCLWLLYCSDWNCHLITFDHETPWSNLCLSKAAAEKKAQVETAQPSADKHSDSWETFFRCICNQPPNHVKQTAFFLGVYPRRSAERSWWIRAPGWWFLLLGECPKIVIFPDNLSLFVARHSLDFLRGNNQPTTNRLKTLIYKTMQTTSGTI